MMSELSCTNLSKKYDDKLVVDGIDINLKTKKVIGLLGPNGAGKTTTFFMIVGLIHCNSGQIMIMILQVYQCILDPTWV